MIASILTMHGILLAASHVLKTTNHAIDNYSHRNPVHSYKEALWLDILCPTHVVSEFITNYDHLRLDDQMGWQGLKSWLSNYNPPRKMAPSTQAMKGDEDINKTQRHLSCAVAETWRMSSVDTIMEGLAPKKNQKKRTKGDVKSTERKLGGALVPYNVCVEWTIAPHVDRPNKWTQLSIDLHASHIQKLDSTEVRLSLLQNEVIPAKLPSLLLELLLDHKTDALTAITATILRWVKRASETAFRNEEKVAGRFKLTTVATAVMKWLKQPVAVQLKDLSKGAQEAIESNHVKFQMAQSILDEIERTLAVNEDLGSCASCGEESEHNQVANGGQFNRSNDRKEAVSETSLDSHPPISSQSSKPVQLKQHTILAEDGETEAVRLQRQDQRRDSIENSTLHQNKTPPASATSNAEEGTGRADMELADDDSSPRNSRGVTAKEDYDMHDEDTALPTVSDASLDSEDVKGRHDLYRKVDDEREEKEDSATDSPVGTYKDPIDTTSRESGDDIPTNEKSHGESSISEPTNQKQDTLSQDVRIQVTPAEPERVLDGGIPGLLDQDDGNPTRKRFVLVAAVCWLCILNIYLCLTR